MSTWFRAAIGGIVLTLGAANLIAGGSGLNVVVVVNTNSANSLQLGNYYCEKRAVPPQNVLRIGWSGSTSDWTRTNLDTLLRAPLAAMLASRQLTNQIEYVLLSMDIPYRVTENTGSSISSGVNSTTSALFHGFKVDGCGSCPIGIPSCNLAPGSSNSYAGSEGIFRQTPPISATSNSWLAMMMTSSNLAQARAVVDRGVAADGTFPTQTVYLAKSADSARNIRYRDFANAIFNARLRGNYAAQSTNTASTFGLGTVLGYQSGIQLFNIYGDFAPGAMADNLTSYGGDLFGSPDHTRALGFINAGATASYGTVVEPCAYPQKFPSPQNYFYQARGFSVAECYYQSLTNPYQGILVGEPLTAPFALPCAGGWSNLSPNALLSGTTNLTLQVNAAGPDRPVNQVDLFVDGTFALTLTNIPPAANNVLYVVIDGIQTNYTVPANASIKSVANNLTVRLSGTGYTNATKVRAFAHGDRIELQLFDRAKPGVQVPVSVSNHIGSGSAATTFIRASGSNFLDSIAYGIRRMTIGGTVVLGDYLQLTVTKTNGAPVSVNITNSTPDLSLAQFVQQFMNTINAEAGLQTSDGLVAEDLAPSDDFADAVDFNLRARAPGLAAAQIQGLVVGTFDIAPVGAQRLDENLPDLQPRQHLYITAGVTNLSFAFGFNPATQADGFHELTAVAYEGSHVRTQQRIAQLVRIQNTSLSAVFNCLLCDTNTALEATLQFSVVANTNTVSRIELFSTGGSWGVVSNQATATFSLAATNLGEGLHPFYALVMRSDGKLYRTETKWIRLISNDGPFTLAITSAAPDFQWPATAGRRYEVLSTTNTANGFVLRDSLVPTNSPGRWMETNNNAPARFYRVRTAP